jgi:hypothetical protein
MKGLLLLAVAVLFLTGCPSSNNPPTPPVLPNTLLQWQTNGNPGALPCPTVSPTNCVASVVITDITTGVSYTVSPTLTSYVVPGSTDSFEVKVTGYDQNGNVLTSIFAYPVVK